MIENQYTQSAELSYQRIKKSNNSYFFYKKKNSVASMQQPII